VSIAKTIAVLVGSEAARAVGPRRALLVSSTTLLVGLGLVGLRPTDPNDTALIDLGMVITLLSLLLLIGGIHTYGRLGPDDGEKAGRAS
jgi:hypothetical protein